MINRILFILFCALAPSITFAQVRVEVAFQQETYLPEEPLVATVRIFNSSGQTLTLGTNLEWLTFSIESADGAVVKQKKPADVMGAFELPSAHRAKKEVNLADAFDLSRFGRYYVTANLRIPQWRQNFSNPKRAVFGISTGVKLWETPFGLPDPKEEGRPEIRKFQLIQANHQKQLSLYVRITDESEGYTYNIFPLGALMGFSRPEPQVDRWSNLHVLFQDGARSFRYNVITPAGMLLTRETWDIYEDGRPSMKMNEEGRISMTGGLRRVSSTDIPPPDLQSERIAFEPAEFPGTSSSTAGNSAPDKPKNAEKSSK